MQPERVAFFLALMAELADAQDLKSCVHMDVRVRLPVGALILETRYQNE